MALARLGMAEILTGSPKNSRKYEGGNTKGSGFIIIEKEA